MSVSATVISAISTGFVFLSTIGGLIWKASKHSSRIAFNEQKISDLEKRNKELANRQFTVSEQLKSYNSAQDIKITEINTNIALIKSNQEHNTAQMLLILEKQDARLDKMDKVVDELKEVSIRLEERIPIKK